MYSNQYYLSSLLQRAGLVEQEEIDALMTSVSIRARIVERLLECTELEERDVAQTMGESLSVPIDELSGLILSEESFDLISYSQMERYQVIPLKKDSQGLSIALVDPLNIEILEVLTHLVGCPLRLHVTTPSAVREVLRAFKGSSEIVKEVESAPTIQLVDELFFDAVRQNASDIHLEPLKGELRVRYRIDGRLQVVATHSSRLSAEIIARIKVMSGTMKIAEKRLPQDGRVQKVYEGREIDFRVSSLPSHHGETLVMRVLDRSTVCVGMSHMGLSSAALDQLTELTKAPDGMILVTGPTGAGKTTTLYSCLEALNDAGRKIITVEDPVEYQIRGINQVMVRSEIGMSFVSALRAMLRQAPNIIMVGEIRDLETASISINASLTGHLVLSTLHTNDSTSAIARLENIGVKRFLIASGIRAVIAQRLVRRLCESCKQAFSLQLHHVTALRGEEGLQGVVAYEPVGCRECRHTGYKGRIGVFELFVLDDELRLFINEGMTASTLRSHAKARGLKTLWDDGVEKVLAGHTSISELLTTLTPESDR